MKHKNTYVFWAFAVVIAGAFLASGLFKIISAAAITAFFAFLDKKSVAKAANWKFWVFPLVFFSILPFITGERNAVLRGLNYSPALMLKNAGFLLHAYVVSLIFVFVSENYSIDEIVEIFEKRKILSKAGLRMALALSVLRRMKNMVLETHFFYRSGRKGRAAYFLGMPGFFGAVLRNTGRIAWETAVLFFLRRVRL